MQNNSQSHRDRFDSKAAPVRDEPKERGLRAEMQPVDDSATTKAVKAFTTGMVTECLKLNVRKEPSADGEVLAIIDALSEVKVDVDESTDDFYKVCTAAGIEGFCMRKYIALKR